MMTMAHLDDLDRGQTQEIPHAQHGSSVLGIFSSPRHFCSSLYKEFFLFFPFPGRLFMRSNFPTSCNNAIMYQNVSTRGQH